MSKRRRTMPFDHEEDFVQPLARTLAQIQEEKGKVQKKIEIEKLREIWNGSPDFSDVPEHVGDWNTPGRSPLVLIEAKNGSEISNVSVEPPSNKRSWLDSVVIASSITALGGIIAALIYVLL
jgi:hypothetical protein